jgi:hypothetical protein
MLKKMAENKYQRWTYSFLLDLNWHEWRTKGERIYGDLVHGTIKEIQDDFKRIFEVCYNDSSSLIGRHRFIENNCHIKLWWSGDRDVSRDPNIIGNIQVVWPSDALQGVHDKLLSVLPKIDDKM